MDQANCHSDLDVRCGFLLQPIKDLTKNFDIDLVSRLGDYLSEITKITILFNDGVTTLNFAEAALIIQGSASVYSQKVEYLYRLTFSVLDLLGNKKQHLQPSSQTDEPTQSCDGEEQFLTLDDINECSNTCMRHDNADGPNARDIAPQTPSVLMRLDDADRAERPLISRNGEVLGSMNDFRMNTSCLHPAGIMLFDLSHLSPLHQSFSTSSRQHQAIEKDVARTDGAALPDQVLDDQDADEGFPTDLGFDDDDSNRDDELLPARNQRSTARHRNTDERPTSAILEDAWKLLDPHKPGRKNAERLFRKGKVFKLPDNALATQKKRKLKGFPDVMLPKMSFGELCNSNYFSRNRTKPVSSFKATEFTDFETLFWEMTKKCKNKRFHKKTGLYELNGETDRQKENHLHVPDDHDDDDDDEADDIHLPEVDLCELLHQNGADAIFDNHTVANEHDSDVFDVVLPNSYEELVQRYVEGFMNSARLYLQDTALAQRVAEWENKIVPKLQEEEKRRPFDIHEYGSEVIKALDALGGSVKPVLFGQLVEDRAEYEVCRYLLATLQLANFGNVELGCPAQLSVDTATCKLLSRRRHFDELTNYRVPSFAHKAT